MQGIPDRTGSLQIQICRTLCIFFMISVHVRPGLSEASIISSGSLAWIGAFWPGFLGHASEATLSFISGILLWQSLQRAPTGTIISRKARTLLIPMLVWGLVMMALRVTAGLLTGRDTPDFVTGASPLVLLNALTGALGPTDNLSLFFLRDLFVASALVALALPLITRFPRSAVSVTLLIAASDAAEPLIFRSSILFFVTTGTALAARGHIITAISRLRLMLPLALALLLILLFQPYLGVFSGGKIRNLATRGFLVCVTLALSGCLAASGRGRILAVPASFSYETYLIHLPLLSLLWIPWQAITGGAMRPAYILFFTAAPFTAFAAGYLLNRIAATLPAWLQILLRGRATESRPPPVASTAPKYNAGG